MGNMDEYIALTTRAKAEGGPELMLAAIEKLAAAKGFGKGAAVVAVGVVAVAGGKYLWDKYRPGQTEAVGKAVSVAVAEAESHKWNTVSESREMAGDLTLTVGDRFKALIRDGDVVMIEVADREDNPFPASGAVLEEISDFVLTDLDG
ncbi:hypothetical protein ABID81_002553 [Frigoribacterium sp. PvP054]|uniref:hypothetical protein n=1 Tax=Frigoribacterium sp. PvP054 TaxID=3156438 RepID=UPI00339622A6